MTRPTKPPTPEERFAALVARAARHLTPEEAQLLHAGFDSLAASRRSAGGLAEENRRLKAERDEVQRQRELLAATVAAFPDAHDAANLAHARRQRDLGSRALARAHALAEGWDGSDEPITRTQAAELLSSAIELNGWEQIGDPKVERLACLYAVATPTPERSA